MRCDAPSDACTNTTFSFNKLYLHKTITGIQIAHQLHNSACRRQTAHRSRAISQTAKTPIDNSNETKPKTGNLERFVQSPDYKTTKLQIKIREQGRVPRAEMPKQRVRGGRPLWRNTDIMRKSTWTKTACTPEYRLLCTTVEDGPVLWGHPKSGREPRSCALRPWECRIVDRNVKRDTFPIFSF